MSHAPTARLTAAHPQGLVYAPESPLAETARTCTRLAQSEATVLLTGETGTGKEVFARFIHARSARAERPFVAVNCGAIPEALLESELFGHVRGAFTGANAARKGRIAAAEGGTLFLDEVGELPLSLQVKLLRVLQERSYEPVGSAESVPANFRLVAATNRDLEAEVAAGRFRRDLYYRLLVCPVELPALRARRMDVGPLFLQFWGARGETRPVDALVLQQLERYEWPGNVRELENLVERLSVCTEGPRVTVDDLPASFRSPALTLVASAPSEAPQAALPAPALAAPADERPELLTPAALPRTTPTFPVDLQLMLRELEESYIAAALERTAGNKKAAADLLGLQRTTLVEKLRRKGGPATAPRAVNG